MSIKAQLMHTFMDTFNILTFSFFMVSYFVMVADKHENPDSR